MWDSVKFYHHNIDNKILQQTANGYNINKWIWMIQWLFFLSGKVSDS